MSSTVEANGRTVGGTEYSWCKAIRGGTGIAVLSLLLTKPIDISRFQTSLHKLQNSHPILRSKLHQSNTTDTSFSFLTSPTPFIKIESHSLNATSEILNNNKYDTVSVSPLQKILEHELNRNAWREQDRSTTGSDMLFATVYAMPDAKTSVVVMRLHVAACDRTTAVSLLRELLVLMTEDEKETNGVEIENVVPLAIEDLVPGRKAKKNIWARGLDVLSYSVNSFRFTNLKFNDTKNAKFSQVVRMELNQNDTKRFLDGCKQSKIKVCGAISAAGLMAAHSNKNSCKKYGIITLTDCRSTLDPPLSTHHFGFYHAAILNNHVMKGGESLWELAKRTYGAFSSSKNNDKHFSDMADMNFLMCKAIENPGLTSSSRTSIMSVFEDTVVDDGGEMQREDGVDDYMGCASVHGLGPSMAIFDTIRDGKLDCVCVYPAPLHSREQMQELINKMKAILIEGGKTYEEY
ncbi:uncharacterized protein LOC127125629 [Lathyrus oleraceus]|uniref:Condensation domain-containing protein n=1 Tax=Pisum sativum TaxID=3888 RepID=A0A9D4XQV0_PEA|nr:uncharacterized protein LOC127125629 [Pisum sativum]KAI5425444.1 hypothetical protein KIW84_031299 [Pisum sativum]